MGFLGTRGKGHLFQGNKGNKGQILREHGNKDNIREQEHKTRFQFWGTGEHANFFQRTKGTGKPPSPLEGPQHIAS